MPKYNFCPSCSHALEASSEEGEERLRCPSCSFVHYDNPTPVVAAIVQRGDDVILVQNIGWPSEWFGLVSGFLEREDETPELAVLREVHEELGVHGELQSLVGVYPFRRMNQVILAYHVLIHDDVTPNPDEIAATKAVPITKLKPWPFGTGAAVKEWLATRK